MATRARSFIRLCTSITRRRPVSQPVTHRQRERTWAPLFCTFHRTHCPRTDSTGSTSIDSRTFTPIHAESRRFYAAQREGQQRVLLDARGSCFSGYRSRFSPRILPQSAQHNVSAERRVRDFTSPTPCISFSAQHATHRLYVTLWARP